jgi:tetratricopeptide (TPR) repeat protein
LGEAAIIGQSDEVGVSESALRCDTVAFECACEAGRFEEALDLYQGDLLDGVFVSGAPDFERWLDEERARLRGLATEAADALTARHSATRSFPLALHWARRAAQLNPFDEVHARRLIELLNFSGDPGSALLAYDEFAKHLAKVLEVKPSAETRALVVRIRASSEQTRDDPFRAPPVDRPPSQLESPVRNVGSAKRFGLTPRWLTAAIVVGLAVSIGLLASSRLGVSTTQADPNMVAVLPFRVTGDSSLAYLRDGMLDLLAARLTGERGPYAADPQAVMRAWRRLAGPSEQDLSRDAELQVARRLGAGHLLLGSIVGTVHTVVISASLLQLPSGERRGSASVEGPPDSLLALVDRLTTQVLAYQAGEPSLASGTSLALPALRFYLDGKAEYRRGNYEDAATHFAQALVEDSTFALAALGLRMATGWVGPKPETRRAWALRQRLSTRDRAILTGLAGPHFPGPSSEREFLSAWEAAVIVAPAQPEAWYDLGDALYHSGALLGEDPLHTRATDAFRHAVALDSGFAAPLAHLVELAARSGDTATVGKLGSHYLTLDSVGEFPDYLRWRIASALGDSSVLADLRARMSKMGGESLRRIIITSQLDGVPIDDADRAAAVWATLSDAPLDRWLRLLRLHDFALNRGAPSAALAWTDSLRAIWPLSHAYLQIRVGDALYAEGDKAVATRAIDALAPAIDGPVPQYGTNKADEYAADLCTVQQWRLTHGDTVSASRSIARLLSRSRQQDSTGVSAHNHWCAILLQALLSAARSESDAATSFRALDSLLLTGPREIEILSPGYFQSFAYGNLVASNLLEDAGDLPGALAAVRRRPYHSAGATYLAPYLLREGRLAALTGDRKGAIRAYRHYLALRPHPERDIAPEVADVRAALLKLEQE